VKHWLPLLLLLILAGCDASWTFAVLGDAGPADPDDPPSPILRAAIERINNSPSQLVIFAGDLIHGRTLFAADTRRQFTQAHEVLGRLRPRLLLVPGNHDVDGADGPVLFARQFDKTPWIVTHRGWTFIGLSTEEPGLHGALSAIQREWLTAQLRLLKKRGRTVIVLHRPPWPTLNEQHRLHSLPQPELHRLFVEWNVTAVFSGHEHQFHQEIRDGVRYVITGGAGADLLEGAAHHFTLAHARGRRLTVEPIPLP